MPRTSAKRWVWVLVCSALVLLLLACGGPALLARAGALPEFDADIPIWPGTTLTIHSTSARACAVAARCQYQLKIQSAVSVWLLWQEYEHGTADTFGRRLLYIPVEEPVTR